MNYFFDPIKNYATFRGRATRKQYWLFILLYTIFYFALSVLDMTFGVYDMEAGVGLLSALYSLILIIPSFALLARRLHDIGRSGWWILIIIIPLIGVLVLFIFTLLDSQREENRHGISPKYGNIAPATAAIEQNH